MGDVLWGYMKRDVRLYQVPGNKYFDKFSQTHEAIGQKTQATDEGKNDGDIVRSTYSFSCKTKPRGQPGGTRIRVGTAKPFSQEHHIENLVKYRPQPGNPNAFETIDKAQGNHPHSTADVKHVRCITQPEKVPRKLLPGKQVALFVFPRFLPEINTDQKH